MCPALPASCAATWSRSQAALVSSTRLLRPGRAPPALTAPLRPIKRRRIRQVTSLSREPQARACLANPGRPFAHASQHCICLRFCWACRSLPRLPGCSSPAMVRFSLPGKKLVTPGDDDDASSSSGSALEGLGPATPDAGEPAATETAKRKYWPSDAEVAAVLERLSEQDRGMCDEAMANRWVLLGGGGTVRRAVAPVGLRTGAAPTPGLCCWPECCAVAMNDCCCCRLSRQRWVPACCLCKLGCKRQRCCRLAARLLPCAWVRLRASWLSAPAGPPACTPWCTPRHAALHTRPATRCMCYFTASLAAACQVASTIPACPTAPAQVPARHRRRPEARGQAHPRYTGVAARRAAGAHCVHRLPRKPQEPLHAGGGPRPYRQVRCCCGHVILAACRRWRCSVLQ